MPATIKMRRRKPFTPGSSVTSSRRAKTSFVPSAGRCRGGGSGVVSASAGKDGRGAVPIRAMVDSGGVDMASYPSRRRRERASSNWRAQRSAGGAALARGRRKLHQVCLVVPSSRSDARVPSMRLSGRSVAMTRVRLRSAVSNSARYSRSVRSRPPITTSMLMSKSFASAGALPEGMTRSMTRSRRL